MCGFFGIVGQYDKERAFKALRTLRHRGPDKEGVYEEEGFFLGHERLYILDRSAHQPLSDGVVLAFNGEIYNYQNFHPTSDTKALLEAYKRYGKQFLEHIEGMYALVVWNGKSLLLARDLFGKKPLYYAQKDGLFLFASEIKAILSYFGGAKFNQKAISGYLSFGALPNEETFYEDIYKLRPGEVVEFGDKQMRHSFVEVNEEYEGDLQALITRSVKKRLQGDFEVAALLSGGVDSSLVSALAKKEQGYLATFSIGYAEGRYSELPYAREVARHIGSDHHEIYFYKDDFFATFEAALYHFEEPIGDSASLPLWFLMQEVKRQGYRVVLSGEGGDEIFLGYRQYFEMADLLRARNLKYKNWLKNYFRANFSPNKEWEWYKRIWSDEPLFRSSCEVFTDLQKNLFLRQNVRDGESLEYLPQFKKEDFETFTKVDLLVRLAALYLHKLDIVSMAHSIEARTPLLDGAILQAALVHPDRARAPKYLLKEIAKKYLPRSIVDRKKRGFSYPHMEWLFVSEYPQKMVAINKQAGFFREDQLQFLIQNAKRNRFSRHFWLVLAFLLWFERRFL